MPTPRNFHFLLIPQRGDTVRSLTDYTEPNTPLVFAKTIATRVVEKRTGNTARPELLEMARADQAFVEVVVIQNDTKEAVFQDMVRRP